MAPPPKPQGAYRRVATSLKKRPAITVAGGAGLVVLSILFWLIFYQNLPPNMGLREAVPESTFATASVPDVSTGNTTDVSTGNTFDRTIKICMLAMSLYVIARRWPLTRSLARHSNLGAAALLLLAPLSALWSIEPSETILRSITLLSIALVCFAISLAGWERQRFQQLAIPPIMFILIASLLLGMIYPNQIVEPGEDISQRGAWHGITLTKNQFGMIASLGVIIFVNRWLAREGRAYWAIAGAAVAFTCLILSRSSTSFFATILGVLFMVLVLRVPLIRQHYSTHLVIAIAATILLYQLVIQNVIPGAYTLLAPVRSFTGKDATFSARTIIWDIVKEHIRYAPYLGSGYAAYWVPSPLPTSPSYIFMWLMYFYPTEAHNGYLDIVCDLGWVGLLCLLAFLFLYMRQALQLMRIDRAQGSLYLALLFQEMVINMSESEWLARDSIFTILLLAIACMARGLREARLQTQPSAAPGPVRRVASR